MHAVAGIGSPGQLFASLRQAGVRLQEHMFLDHHDYVAAELDFGVDQPLPPQPYAVQVPL